MPHITVQMYPGRSREVKQHLADKLAQVASEELGKGIEHFSVSIEDVPQSEWKAKVWDDAMDLSNDKVFVRPHYEV